MAGKQKGTGLRERLVREARDMSTFALASALREARRDLHRSNGQPHHAIEIAVYEAALAERDVTVIR